MLPINSSTIRSKRLPGPGNEAVHYFYSPSGQPTQIISGDHDCELAYDADDATLASANVRQGRAFEMRQRFKYHGGLLKETKVRFASNGAVAFDSATFRYQYDGNGRPAAATASIGNGSLAWRTSYAANSGAVEMLGDLRIARSPNRTMLEDINSKYRKTVDLDGNGRVGSILYGLGRADLLKVELEYDQQNRLMKRRMVGKDTKEERFDYTADGHLKRVQGSSNYEFR